MSVRPRPSIRMPSSRTIWRTVFFWTRLNRLLLTRASRRADSSRAGVSPPLRWARTASPIDVRRVEIATRQVVREPEQQVGGRLGVRQGAVALRELDAEEARQVTELVRLGAGIALAGDDQRVEVRARLEPEAVALGLFDEAEVEADVVADDQTRRRRSPAACRPPPSGSGAPLTSLSVMPCIWLPTIGAPGIHERRPACRRSWCP